ncbi:MAG: D-glycero-beta-D-manno-heptose 1-phosphate adenylyltransferase [Planctomycetota bacterium]
MDELLSKLAAWKPFRALVLGDFMLDQLVYGDAERLSADAPVPILDVRKQEDRPGGAANLCLDLVAMRARVRAVGVTGADAESKLLREALAASGVEADALVADAARPTTVKRSLVGLAQARHPQKMFRVDIESREPVGPSVERLLIDAVEREIAEADVLVIEDYGKGVCSERVCQGAIDAARAAKIPVVVDPAGHADYERYRRATVITPNRTEAERATGLRTHERGDAEHNAELAHALLGPLDLDAVVLTLDRDGALLLQRAGQPVVVPTIAREVYDVTGAGDMMTAALAAARANACAWRDAVEFANAAAGLEVEQFGVVPIPLERIHAELIQRRRAERDPITPTEVLLVEIAALRAAGKKIVFTNGCFDILHAGHTSLLERAAALGDHLVVGLNSDASVGRLKGDGRPVNTQNDRAAVLAALRAVDAVTLFEQDTPLELIEKLAPDVLVKGADYRGREVVGREIVEARGGRVELIELVPGRSTSATIDAMRQP